MLPAADKQWLNRFRVLLAFALPVLVVAGIAVKSNAPEHRLQWKDVRCSWDRITSGSDPVDIAVFGGSGILTSIDPEALARQFDTSGDTRVLNVARNWYGADAVYESLDDFLRTRKLELAIVAVRLDDTEPYQKASYASWHTDQFITALSLPGQPTVTHTATVLHMFLRRLGNTVFGKRAHATVSPENRESFEGDYTSPSTCLPSDVADTRTRRRVDDLKTKFEASPEVIDVDISDPKYRYTMEFLKKTAALAHASETQIIFLHVPVWHRPAWSTNTANAFEAYTGAPLLRVTRALREQVFDADGFRDETHLRNSGRELITRWVASQLTTRTSEPSNQIATDNPAQD